MDDYAVRLELAMEAERRRIAEFMHDEIGQSLTALRLAMSLLKHGLPERSKPDLDEALLYCDQALAQTRQLMTDISPVVLYKFGLQQALRTLAKHLRDESGVAVEVTGPELPRLPAAAEVLLFRAVETVLRQAVQQTAPAGPAVALQLDSTETEVALVLLDPSSKVSERWSRWLRSDESYGVRLKVAHLDGQLKVRAGEDDRTELIITTPRKPRQVESEDD